MRRARIKAALGHRGLYHCMSRVVGGAFLLGDQEKAVFISQMRKVADFCGVRIINFCVMSNHYHQLVEVPPRVNPSNQQLLRKVIRYYGMGSRQHLRLQNAIDEKGESLEKVRGEFIRMMGDISVFQKILKQRFTTWYNLNHNRRGTLWMERFKSVLIDYIEQIMRLVSAYIDLNPVRARLVTDPKDYSYCGYAAALRKDQNSRSGLQMVMGVPDWTQCAELYRELLISKGSRKARGKSGFIKTELIAQSLNGTNVEDQVGIPGFQMRYLTDSLVLGSVHFVEDAIRRHTIGKSPDTERKPHAVIIDSNKAFHVFHKLRKRKVSDGGEDFSKSRQD